MEHPRRFLGSGSGPHGRPPPYPDILWAHINSREIAMRALRILFGVALAAAILAAVVPRHVDDPEQAFQRAVAGALASDADDRLTEVALDQYPDQAPAIIITYGHLELFREQLARFGPQVVPIVAAYQRSRTIADLAQMAKEGWQRFEAWLKGGGSAVDLAPLTAEQRGLIALLKMRAQGNGFVGLWEITAAGEARWVPSRLVTLGGAELLFGGLTALERDLVQGKEVPWPTYGLAAVDLAAIASGVALLRFARTAAGGASAARATGAAEGVVAAQTGAEAATLRSGALAAGEVLGINAVRVAVPVGVMALMALHPGVFTRYAWLLADSLGLPGVLGPIALWSLVLLPLSFLLSWLLLSVRLLRVSGRLLAGAGRGCQRLAVRLAATDDR
jgi:hypothetical protein